MYWFKMFANDYLADVKIRNLTIYEKGTLQIMWCLLQTQTDLPGVFVINEKILSIPDIAEMIRCASPPDHTTIRNISGWVSATYQKGVLQQYQDGYLKGAFYSERIVKDYEESELMAKAGRASVQQRVKQGVQQGVQPESETESETEQRSTHTAVDAHGKPPTPLAELPRASIARIHQKTQTQGR